MFFDQSKLLVVNNLEASAYKFFLKHVNKVDRKYKYIYSFINNKINKELISLCSCSLNYFFADFKFKFAVLVNQGADRAARNDGLKIIEKHIQHVSLLLEDIVRYDLFERYDHESGDFVYERDPACVAQEKKEVQSQLDC